jgi:hypothetical protein
VTGVSSVTYTLPGEDPSEVTDMASKTDGSSFSTRPPDGRTSRYGHAVKTRGIVLLTVALASFVLGSGRVGSARAATTDGRVLDNGFRVVQGTRLLGPVFPRISISAGDSGAVIGWSALLAVDTDATTAMNAYASLAQALGYRAYPNGDTSCADDVDGAVACTGAYVRDSTLVVVSLRVCGTCTTPISTMGITASTGRISLSAPSGDSTSPISLAAAKPTAKLSAEQREQAQKQTPEVGDLIAPGQVAIEVVPGSRALVPAVTFDPCAGAAFTAVLKVTGNPQSVLEQYLVQLHLPVSSKMVSHARKGSTSVTQYDNGEDRITLVTRSSGASHLHMDFCND